MPRFIFTAEFDSAEELAEWLSFRKDHGDLSPSVTQTLKVAPVVEPVEGEITEHQLRLLVSQRIEEGHRDSILKKIKSYGAQNVSALKQENYKPFWDYLVALQSDAK